MGARSDFSGLHAALAPDWSASQTRSGKAVSSKQDAEAQSSRLSAWSRSVAKRVFDALCVLASLPIALPLSLLVALAVRITSPGPVLFCQQRMGQHGRIFTVLKFRTMPQQFAETPRTGLTTTRNQSFTPIGPFLRRWKLDELPQLFNILRGEMSLVGPRPKLPCYQAALLECRPGLTGFATMVFAQEEHAMAQVPNAELEAYYSAVVKPFKQRLDMDYMEQATFLSDLALITRSIFRQWNTVALTALPPWLPPVEQAKPATRIAAQKLPSPTPQPELSKSPQ